MGILLGSRAVQLNARFRLLVPNLTDRFGELKNLSRRLLNGGILNL